MAEKADEFRIAALGCAIRTCSSVVGDLLAWHPEAEALRQRLAGQAGCSLGELLWKELSAGERGRFPEDGLMAARGSAVGYWQRRRRLGEWAQWQRTAATLPGYWVKLLEMPAAEARAWCVGLGTEMLLAALVGQSTAKMAAYLGPLGGERALSLIEQLRQNRDKSVSVATAARWRDAYARSARVLSGSRILSALGRSLLAGLYRQLPADQQAIAAQTSRTSLPSLLEHDAFLEPMGEDELAWGRERLQRVGVAGGTERKPDGELGRREDGEQKQ